MEDNKTKQWYVVHAYSGYENFVMREIMQRAQLQNVTDKFGEIVVPSEEVVEMRANLAINQIIKLSNNQSITPVTATIIITINVV